MFFFAEDIAWHAPLESFFMTSTNQPKEHLSRFWTPVNDHSWSFFVALNKGGTWAYQRVRLANRVTQP